MERPEHSYDPETVGMLRQVLDDAWARLSPTQRSKSDKSALALVVLKLAANGERDPARLSAQAMLSVRSFDKTHG
jgi:hypothetical protein